MKSIYVFGKVDPFGLVTGGRAIWQSALKIKGYIVQKSIFTFSDEGLSIPKEKINSVNEWWNKLIYEDLSKSYVRQMFDEPADYVLIDALSSIFALREVTNENMKTRVSYSQPMEDFLQSLESEGELKIGRIISTSKMSEPDIRRGG